MTAPTPANLSDVRRTASRLLNWLRTGKHAQIESPLEFFRTTHRKRSPHPRGSQPQVVTQAFLTAFAAITVMSIEPMMRALSEMHELRSRTASLARALNEIDQHLAKKSIIAAKPSFSECGHEMTAALEAVARKLETVRGVEAPTTAAKWKAFVTATVAALLDARMPLDEVLLLFPEQGDTKKVKARLDRRKLRHAARSPKKTKPRKKSQSDTPVHRHV